jgi:F-type H+-transporting ATPase subunit alpha
MVCRTYNQESLIEFETGLKGIVLNLEEDNVGAVLLGSATGIKEGAVVKVHVKLLLLKVGEGMLGRVVDTLGMPIDGKGANYWNYIRNAIRA